jgi:hypothetical protein
MSYEEAKAKQDALFAASKAASAVLVAYPKGPMGLTPDEIKVTPKWRAERAASDRAFQEARAFNAWFTKRFAKEYRAERSARLERMTR